MEFKPPPDAAAYFYSLLSGHHISSSIANQIMTAHNTMIESIFMANGFTKKHP
jgi:hypothetical protein